MADMTIEEAFSAMLNSVAFHHHHSDKSCAYCEEAARALVMTAAEEAFARHHPHTCGIWAAQFNDKFRARIAALGGKDGT